MKTSIATYIFLILILAEAYTTQAQVGIGTTSPHSSCILDLTSTTKGMLVPRMTSAQKSAVASPGTGLLIYQTDGTTGFYYYTGTQWLPLLDSKGGWTTTGNSGTTAGTNFVGTTDAVDFVTKTGGTERMRVLSTGNIGIGTTAPGSALDVKGTIRLSGSTSGYVGFAPAAAAGSTTYTLPSADGTNGQALSTNGSGTLSWATVLSNDWHITGNSGTTAGTNFIGTTDAIDFITKTGGTERMRVLSTGNIGIGTTAPGSALDVKGTIRLSGSTSGYVGFAPAAAAGSTTYTLPSADGTNGQALSTNGSGTLSWATVLSNDWHTTGNSGTTAGTNFIGTTDAIDFVTKTGGTERMRVLSTGNIGIGTTAPGSALDIKGTIRLSGSTSGYVGFTPAAAAGSTTYTLPSADGSSGQALTTNGTGTLSWATVTGSDWSTTGNTGTTAGTNYIGTTDATDFVTKTNGTERMRVTSAGYVGIGTTTPNKSLVVLMNSSGTNVVSVENTNAAGFSSIDFLNNSGTLSSTFGYTNASAGGIFSSRAYMNSYNNDFVLTRNSAEYNIFIEGSNGNVGFGTSTPTSVTEVNGAFATKYSSQSGAGAVTLDNTAEVWYFTGAASSISFPTASTCTNRRYIIVNRSGGARTTGTYTNLTGSAVTTLANNTSLEIISDGTNWLQIK